MSGSGRETPQRIERLRRAAPGGDPRLNAKIATSLASCLDDLGRGEVESVRMSLRAQEWLEGTDPGALDRERVELTRDLCRGAAMALEMEEPNVLAAGVALHHAGRLWAPLPGAGPD